MPVATMAEELADDPVCDEEEEHKQQEAQQVTAEQQEAQQVAVVSEKAGKKGGRPPSQLNLIQKKQLKRQRMNSANLRKKSEVSAALSLAAVLVIIPEISLKCFMVHHANPQDRETVQDIMSFVDADNPLYTYDVLDLIGFSKPTPSSVVGDLLSSKLLRVREEEDLMGNMSLEEFKTVVSKSRLRRLYPKTSKSGKLQLPCINIAVAAVLRSLLNDEMVPFSTPKMAFARQSSLMHGILTGNEDSLVNFIGNNFQVVIDGHDTMLYQDSYKGHPGPVYLRYIEFLSRISTFKYVKCYPPVSTINLFSDKKLLCKILQPVMLPTVFMKCPGALHLKVSQTGHPSYQSHSWGGMLWDTIHSIAKQKLLDVCTGGRIATNTVATILTHCKDGIILKPVDRCSTIGVVVLRKGDDGQPPVMAETIHGARIVSPQDWLDPDSKPVDYIVQPYLEHLRSNELRFFFQYNRSGIMEKLYMVPTEICGTGKHTWWSPIDKTSETIDHPDVINFNRNLTPFPSELRDVLKKSFHGQYPVLCQGLIYRVDMCRNDIWMSEPKCNKTYCGSTHKKELLFTVNEIGVVPNSEMFINDSRKSFNQIHRVAEGITEFLRSNWHQWPK